MSVIKWVQTPPCKKCSAYNRNNKQCTLPKCKYGTK